MARIPKLNWEPSRGRWCLRYRGRRHRFDGGSGKSDRAAKLAAQREWAALKRSIDDAADDAREHLDDYRRCLDEWEGALQWSRDNGATDLAVRAASVVLDLRERLRKDELPPLEEYDFLLPRQPLYTMSDEDVADIALITVEPGQPFYEAVGESVARVRAQEAVWIDRLRTQRRKSGAAAASDTLGGNIKAFLAGKAAEARSGHISAGRVEMIKNHLDVAIEYSSTKKLVSEIDGAWLAGLRSLLLKRIAAKRYSTSYAKDVLASTKQLVKWLVSTRI